MEKNVKSLKIPNESNKSGMEHQSVKMVVKKKRKTSKEEKTFT